MINQLDSLVYIPASANLGEVSGAPYRKMRNDISEARDWVKEAVKGLEELAGIDNETYESVFRSKNLIPPNRC